MQLVLIHLILKFCCLGSKMQFEFGSVERGGKCLYDYNCKINGDNGSICYRETILEEKNVQKNNLLVKYVKLVIQQYQTIHYVFQITVDSIMRIIINVVKVVQFILVKIGV